jgi:hypothetical protein
MNRKFAIKTIAGVLILLGLMSQVALAMGLLNLPADPVSATQTWLGEGGAISTVDVTLSGVGDGFDVTDGAYPGWCAEDNHQPNAPAGTLVTLLDSTTQGVPWDQVNYLLNHKAGSVAEVQVALWLLTGTYDGTFPLTPAAQAMYDDAVANGAGFVPGPNQVVAVILYGDGIGPEGYQDTIIEVPLPPPPPGGEGCTPGYWRNHFEDWPPTGYSTGDDFDATFGVDNFKSDITLGEAIWLGGGGVKKLARHGTAGLLSAAHPEVDYPYTVAEVIAFVQAGEADILVAANELGCEIP